MFICKTTKTRNLKTDFQMLHKNKSDVKVGATRTSWNRIIHWINKTDLVLHNEGLGGESISIHMGAGSWTPVSKEEWRFLQDLPNHMEDQDFLWWFRGKKKKKKILFLAEYKEETCIPRAPGRQYGITGRETCQERRQYKKKKKSEIRNSVSYSHIWATRSVKW